MSVRGWTANRLFRANEDFMYLKEEGVGRARERQMRKRR